MRKYKYVEFQFDLEIERIARRLRKEQRNLKVVIVMDNFQNMGNLNFRGEIQPVNAQGGQEGQNGQIIYGPLGNNIIHMVDHRDRAIRDYAMLTPQGINPEIVRPEVQADNFEFKPVIF